MRNLVIILIIISVVLVVLTVEGFICPTATVQQIDYTLHGKKMLGFFIMFIVYICIQMIDFQHEKLLEGKEEKTGETQEEKLE